MARVHAPEFGDEPWFPRPLRDSLTAFLRVSAEKLDLYRAAVPFLHEVLERSGASRIIDLGSGGGGPLLSILADLPHVNVVLTDLYPNLEAFAQAQERLPGRVTVHTASVDASDMPPELFGVRTLFNMLHHLRPPLAKKVLEDAAHKRQPICIFEVAERDPLAVAAIACAPLAVLAFTPFTQPNMLRLALTYVVPVIPLATGWDGLASCLRAYSTNELRALADEIQVEGYSFRVGQTGRGRLVPTRITYLIGEPD